MIGGKLQSLQTDDNGPFFELDINGGAKFRAIEILDSSGNVLMGSGSAMNYSAIAGTKPPEDADVTGNNQAASIANQAATATNSDYGSVTGTKPPSNADVTGSNEAASIANQAATATNSDYTAVTGSTKPANNADVTGENTFVPAVSWSFAASSLEGFIATHATLVSQNNGTVRIDSTSADPILESPSGLAVLGKDDFIIRARVQRAAGSAWDGKLFYGTAGHSFDAGYYKNHTDTTITGEWVILEWDMSALTAGGNDWINNTVIQIRLDLGASTSDDFLIDWVTIGRKSGTSAPGNATAGATVGTDLNGQWTSANMASSGNFASKFMQGVYIDDLAVDTLQIAGQAVSIAEAAENTTAARLDTGSSYIWNTLSKQITVSNMLSTSAVSIIGLVRYYNIDTQAHSVSITLYRDSTALFTRSINVGPQTQTSYPILEFDEGIGNGTFTYAIGTHQDDVDVNAGESPTVGFNEVKILLDGALR